MSSHCSVTSTSTQGFLAFPKIRTQRVPARPGTPQARPSTPPARPSTPQTRPSTPQASGMRWLTFSGFSEQLPQKWSDPSSGHVVKTLGRIDCGWMQVALALVEQAFFCIGKEAHTVCQMVDPAYTVWHYEPPFPQHIVSKISQHAVIH